jgi:CheY-like chemotaxis protein
MTYDPRQSSINLRAVVAAEPGMAVGDQYRANTLLGPLRTKARTAAAAAGVGLTVTASGEDLPCPLPTLEALMPGMLALVRFVIAHAIDSPQDRAAAKKPASAALTLGARSGPGRLVFAITHDGRGYAPPAHRNDPAEIPAILGAMVAAIAPHAAPADRAIVVTAVANALAPLRARLEIASAPGLGVTLAIVVPLASTPQKAPRVLVVDDALVVRHGLRRLLRALGATVVLARDGETAFDAVCADAAPDLVLTDLTLPRRSGLDLIRVIRMHVDPARAKIPVVVVSGIVAGRHRERALAAGANAWLPRPCTGDNLRMLLERWVN